MVYLEIQKWEKFDRSSEAKENKRNSGLLLPVYGDVWALNVGYVSSTVV